MVSGSATLNAEEAASLQSASTGSSGTATHRLLPVLRSMDRVQFLKHVWSEYGTQVADELVGSYRASSIRQFQSSWKQFQSWLPSDVLTIDKALVLRYLSYLKQHRKLASRTVISHRTALELPLSLGFGINFKDKEFELLTKSHVLQDPPKTANFPQWNLQVALFLRTVR